MSFSPTIYNHFPKHSLELNGIAIVLDPDENEMRGQFSLSFLLYPTL